LRPCREFKSAIREISALIRESRSRPLFWPIDPILPRELERCQEGKEGRRQMLAWSHQTSGSSEFWQRYVASMSRIRLTKPSNSDRTYQEHRTRRSDPRGARAEDGSGVGCWGTLASRNMMLRRKNARYLRALRVTSSRRNRALSPRVQPRAGRANRVNRVPGTIVRIAFPPAASLTNLIIATDLGRPLSRRSSLAS
jgi:hypothetical protein